MRPLKLVTRAFGPYAKELKLDFADLGSHTLFLIHGPTGAGKTTILDAMCFALYGVCSGDDRDTKRVRSDLAGPELVTEVSFDFRLGSEEYRVYRKPEQPKPRLRGSGSTTARPEAVLWRRTHRKTDREEGVVLANQWRSVTEQVEELLGFRSDQFRQVVMLPQGEFRRLLLADSRQRQEILEVLFQTQLYRRIEEALKQAAKDLKQEIDGTDNNLRFILKESGVETQAELNEHLAQVAAEWQERHAALVPLAQAEKEAQEKVVEARRIVEKMKELEEAQAGLQELEKRLSDHQDDRESLRMARQAAAVIADERNLDARAKEVRQADLALQKARDRTRVAVREKERADRLLEEEIGKQAVREEARKRLNRLDDLTAKVAQLVESTRALTDADRKLSGAEEELESVTRSREECIAAIEQAREQLVQAEKVADRIEFLSLKCQEADKAYTQLKQLAKVRKSETARVKEREKALEVKNRSAAKLEAAMTQRTVLEAAWITGQSAILAARLSPGKPCPVCGSTDHPRIATSDVPLPDEKALQEKNHEIDQLRNQLERAQDDVAKQDAEISAVSVEIRLLEESLGDAGQKPLSQIDADRKALAAQLATAQGASKQAAGLRQERAGLDKQLATLTERWTAVNEARSRAWADRQQAEAIAVERATGIPDEYKKPGALDMAKRLASEELQRLEDAFERARKDASQASEALATCRSTEKAASDHATEAARRLMGQREQFHKCLSEAGFVDEEAFSSAKRTGTEIEALDKAIQAFDRKVTAAKDRLTRAHQAADGLEAPDMPALTEHAARAKQNMEQALRAEATLAAKQERLKGSASECNRLTEVKARLETAYAVKGRISEIANGANREGITFQRFVLAALLDDVLLAASKRLHIMSNGRFMLQRVLERADRRAAGGLDLEVHDTYSGTARPVSTLSGGESFLASLSLALGLADVVQAYSGGIQLDAVFVDEGFGSLDPEALDLALKALVDLQRDGRLVGIISHVPTLREIVDARLEVSSQRSGSTARFVIGCGREG